MVISLELIFPKMTSFQRFSLSLFTVQTFSWLWDSLLQNLWINVTQTLWENESVAFKEWDTDSVPVEKRKTERGEMLETYFRIMRIYLMSVSSSTTRSHLVFGTEPVRNLWRMAKVFPQWPANRDMLSIRWPVRLNHILTVCCILVYRDKWSC